MGRERGNWQYIDSEGCTYSQNGHDAIYHTQSPCRIQAMEKILLKTEFSSPCWFSLFRVYSFNQYIEDLKKI